MRERSDEGVTPVLRLRRRLGNELLAAAARHSAISDEITDLEVLRSQGVWSTEEAERYEHLRRQKVEARVRHDQAHRQLVRLPSSPLRAG
jgi:hypothetical protein